MPSRVLGVRHNRVMTWQAVVMVYVTTSVVVARTRTVGEGGSARASRLCRAHRHTEASQPHRGGQYNLFLVLVLPGRAGLGCQKPGPDRRQPAPTEAGSARITLRTSCVYCRTGMPKARARPKSASFIVLVARSISRFCGFMSRCRMLHKGRREPHRNNLVSVDCDFGAACPGAGCCTQRHRGKEAGEPRVACHGAVCCMSESSHAAARQAACGGSSAHEWGLQPRSTASHSTAQTSMAAAGAARQQRRGRGQRRPGQTRRGSPMRVAIGDALQHLVQKPLQQQASGSGTGWRR